MKLPREEEEQRQPGVPDSWQTLPPDTQEEEMGVRLLGWALPHRSQSDSQSPHIPTAALLPLLQMWRNQGMNRESV